MSQPGSSPVDGTSVQQARKSLAELEAIINRVEDCPETVVNDDLIIECYDAFHTLLRDLGGPEIPPDSRARTLVEHDDGMCHGREIAKDPRPLEDFKFDLGDEFIQTLEGGSIRWTIANTAWKFKRSWLVGRDSRPSAQDHRIYRLVSEEMDSRWVNERELLLESHWTLVED